MFETAASQPSEPGIAHWLWTTAVFPSPAMRAEFRERISALNRIEDLPLIHVRDDARRTQLDYWCIDYRRIGLRKLVESCGGTVVADPAAGVRSARFAKFAKFEDEWAEAAGALS